jgi:hypothetical protein
MREKKSVFHYKILPFSEFPNDPRPPSAQTQQEALTDILVQLVTALAAAAKDKSDPLRAVHVLIKCDQILADYASEQFDLLGEYQHLLKTNLRAALRQARRAFFREAFLSRSMEEFATYKKVMVDAGWRTTHTEAMEDYRQVVSETKHWCADGRHLRHRCD